MLRVKGSGLRVLDRGFIVKGLRLWALRFRGSRCKIRGLLKRVGDLSCTGHVIQAPQKGARVLTGSKPGTLPYLIPFCMGLSVFSGTEISFSTQRGNK